MNHLRQAIRLALHYTWQLSSKALHCSIALPCLNHVPCAIGPAMGKSSAQQKQGRHHQGQRRIKIKRRKRVKKRKQAAPPRPVPPRPPRLPAKRQLPPLRRRRCPQPPPPPRAEPQLSAQPVQDQPDQLHELLQNLYVPRLFRLWFAACWWLGWHLCHKSTVVIQWYYHGIKLVHFYSTYVARSPVCNDAPLLKSWWWWWELDWLGGSNVSAVCKYWLRCWQEFWEPWAYIVNIEIVFCYHCFDSWLGWLDSWRWDQIRTCHIWHFWVLAREFNSFILILTTGQGPSVSCLLDLDLHWIRSQG